MSLASILPASASAAFDFAAPPLDTAYAPAGRDTAAELQRQRKLLKTLPLLKTAFDAMPAMVAVLNAHRQILVGNDALWRMLGTTGDETAAPRPGEAVGCLHASDGPDGCGTGLHCAACGAVRAILESQHSDEKIVRECRLLVRADAGVEALDLRVTATPLHVAADTFVVAAIEDISQAKRLAVLQRTFYHDVLNTAGCLRGYGQYLTDLYGPDEVCLRVEHLADELIEAISAQRDLVLAESGDLRVRPQVVSTRPVLEDLRTQYLNHPRSADRALCLTDVWPGTLCADRLLLRRVLGNMILNALEATEPGGAVTVGCVDRDTHVAFFVQNPGEMSDEVRLQIFQRSFSTKEGRGRGIGTYSMKLFGERYLGGRVSFTSAAPQGTTFWLTLPKQP